MKKINVKEFRKNIARYLADPKGIIITKYGEEIATLKPIKGRENKWFLPPQKLQ